MSILYYFKNKVKLEYELKKKISNFDLEKALKINLFLIKRNGPKPHLMARLIQIYTLNNNLEQISYTYAFMKKRGLINKYFILELKKLDIVYR
jgi:hypothetical protein